MAITISAVLRSTSGGAIHNNGIVPVVAWIDFTGTTSTNTSQPFKECKFKVDWGDADKNFVYGYQDSEKISYGAMSAHCYNVAGSYTINITVWGPDGSNGWEQETTTLSFDAYAQTDATNGFGQGGWAIKCINKIGDADFTGKPAGATELNTDWFQNPVNWRVNQVGHSGGNTTVIIDTGSVDPQNNMTFTVEGDPTTYTVTNYAGNTITHTPAANQAWNDNDQLTFTTPAIQDEMSANSILYFKRGSTWAGTTNLPLNNNVYLSAYGSGAKPIFSFSGVDGDLFTISGDSRVAFENLTINMNNAGKVVFNVGSCDGLCISGIETSGHWGEFFDGPGSTAATKWAVHNCRSILTDVAHPSDPLDNATRQYSIFSGGDYWALLGYEADQGTRHEHIIRSNPAIHGYATNCKIHNGANQSVWRIWGLEGGQNAQYNVIERCYVESATRFDSGQALEFSSAAGGIRRSEYAIVQACHIHQKGFNVGLGVISADAHTVIRNCLFTNELTGSITCIAASQRHGSVVIDGVQVYNNHFHNKSSTGNSRFFSHDNHSTVKPELFNNTAWISGSTLSFEDGTGATSDNNVDLSAHAENVIVTTISPSNPTEAKFNFNHGSFPTGSIVTQGTRSKVLFTMEPAVMRPTANTPNPDIGPWQKDGAPPPPPPSTGYAKLSGALK